MYRDQGVKINRASARRVFEVGRYIEQQPRSSAPVIAGPDPTGVATMVLTTTQVTRGSGATPGAGSGKIQKFNGTSYSDLSSKVYPILNDTTALVATNAYVLCVPGPGGKLHFMMTSCENLS
jgi:hypothetical protein